MTDRNHTDLSPFDDLPGDLMIWVLIVSELLVFGAGLLAFLAVRLTDPAGFAAAQDQLHRVGAGINTLILITSGWLAARGAAAAHAGSRGPARRNLLAAATLGMVFLVIKANEFAGLSALGISTETHPLFTFYYLLTGFHAAHVLAGVVILGGLSWRPSPDATENGVAFWHMVDLVWVILFPVIYLVREDDPDPDMVHSDRPVAGLDRPCRPCQHRAGGATGAGGDPASGVDQGASDLETLSGSRPHPTHLNRV